MPTNYQPFAHPTLSPAVLVCFWMMWHPSLFQVLHTPFYPTNQSSFFYARQVFFTRRRRGMGILGTYMKWLWYYALRNIMYYFVPTKNIFFNIWLITAFRKFSVITYSADVLNENINFVFFLKIFILVRRIFHMKKQFFSSVNFLIPQLFLRCKVIM